MTPRIIVLLAAIAAPPACRAQTGTGTPLEIGRSFRLESRTLEESRVLDVSVPDGYATDTDRRYPVVFVLDGEFEGEMAMAVARFYGTMSLVPPVIVVAVRNTDRMRDLTPAPIAGFTLPPEARTAGGADRFLTFLTDELVPYVDRTYRTVPMRVLVGHSLGGLFALYALAQRPEAFTGYVVMEPSVWWNDRRHFDDARAVLRRPAARRARVMTVNTEALGLDTTLWGGAGPMVRELATAGETHASMAMAGLMQSLRTVFADFRPSEWRPGTRPIAMLERYDSLAERVGYPVQIPEQSFALAARMSIDSRHFDDAALVLDRMERTLGVSDRSRELRETLGRERVTPQPASFIPLAFPARRPTSREAARFLGRWVVNGSPGHELEVRASGDTIVIHERVRLPDGEWDEDDPPVIQVTADGTLEWGQRVFRGLAALLVLRGRILDHGTMTVTREVRGWVPRGPGPDLSRTERFRRLTQ